MGDALETQCGSAEGPGGPADRSGVGSWSQGAEGGPGCGVGSGGDGEPGGHSSSGRPPPARRSQPDGRKVSGPGQSCRDVQGRHRLYRYGATQTTDFRPT